MSRPFNNMFDMVRQYNGTNYEVDDDATKECIHLTKQDNPIKEIGPEKQLANFLSAHLIHPYSDQISI